MNKNVICKSVGLCDYQKILLAMKKHISSDSFNNEIWLLEHPSIYTLGTAADRSHIIDSKNIPVIQTDRGGEVTYHGPGQLVIYFMLDIKSLKLGPRGLVKYLQDFIKLILNEYSIESNIIEGAPGVFVNDKKIASIGLRISKGKTYHGISLNVDMDLKPFQNINPCGYKDLQVSQLKDFDKNISIESVKKIAIKKLESMNFYRNR